MSEAQMRRISYLRSIVKDRDAEIERLRAALRDMLRLVEDDEDDPAPYLIDVVCDRARAALDGQPAQPQEEA